MPPRIMFTVAPGGCMPGGRNLGHGCIEARSLGQIFCRHSNVRSWRHSGSRFRAAGGLLVARFGHRSSGNECLHSFVKCNGVSRQITAKSAKLNADGRKTMSSARSNDVSGCQNHQLGSAAHQCAAARASQSQNKAWRTASRTLTVPNGDPNGECQIRSVVLNQSNL
jgi:hypothetical protein